MELPQTVRHALGPEAARDLVTWLSEQLFSSGTKGQIQISAFVARQKVNVVVFEQVSNLFLADEPRLSQREDGNWVWRVPVDFTLPSQGRVGRVGELEVDARYGQVYYSQALLDQMADQAERLLNMGNLQHGANPPTAPRNTPTAPRNTPTPQLHTTPSKSSRSTAP